MGEKTNLEFVGEGGEARVWKFYDSVRNIWVAKREISLRQTNLGIDYHHKNIIMKKLDNFFLQNGVYRTSHIPRPIGSYEKGHFYEFVEGDDSFCWELPNGNEPPIKVRLDEWNEFVAAFGEAGFSVSEDIVASNSSSAINAKNIVHSDYAIGDMFKGRLNSNWKRIDIGEDSLPWNQEMTTEFMMENDLL